MVGWGLCFVGLGTLFVVGAMFPRQMFRLFEAWKFKDPEAAELDDFVVTVRVLVNVCGAIVSYGLAVWNLWLR